MCTQLLLTDLSSVRRVEREASLVSATRSPSRHTKAGEHEASKGAICRIRSDYDDKGNPPSRAPH